MALTQMPFFAGEAIQTLDMNQDGYFEEALKMRNLLREARKRHFSSTLYI
jgi:callose synthase